MLSRAWAVLAQAPNQTELIASVCGQATADNCTVIPTSIEPMQADPAGARAFRDTVELPDSAQMVLLVAGLREVKGVIPAIELCEAARFFAADTGVAGANLTLVIIGHTIEPEYAGRVREMAAARPWIRLVESLPHEAMAGAYGAADVVLNTSVSEGLSFAVMEAMGCGRPVLVSAIPPNIDLAGESSLSPGRELKGHRGLAYRNQAEFTGHLLAVLGDPVAAGMVGENARRHVLAHHGAEAERAALAGVLRLVLGKAM